METAGDLLVWIPLPGSTQGLEGTLAVPRRARGLVIFAHGSGSSRFSPRNRYVAGALQGDGFATLLFDLLSGAEAADRANVFDIPLLASRVVCAVEWSRAQERVSDLPVGLFGASTGAAAALVAAADLSDDVAAVVSRGGRPDLAGEALERVNTPTLLLVGGEDHQVIELNEAAYAELGAPAELRIIPGATHLFEEPGTLETVVRHASGWFSEHLAPEDAQ